MTNAAATGLWPVSPKRGRRTAPWLQQLIRVSSLFRHSSFVIRHFPHHDLGANPAIVSRFLSRETAHDCAVFAAFTGRAQSAVHQCRHKSVRADLSRPAKTLVEPAARRRHTKMYSRWREA